MQRITKSQLENLAALVNRYTGSPEKPYTREGDTLAKHPGSFYISYANGGVSLERLCEGGGATDVLTSGHVTKRELYQRMHAFLKGLEMVQNGQGTL